MTSRVQKVVSAKGNDEMNTLKRFARDVARSFLDRINKITRIMGNVGNILNLVNPVNPV